MAAGTCCALPCGSQALRIQTISGKMAGQRVTPRLGHIRRRAWMLKHTNISTFGGIWISLQREEIKR